MSSFGPSILGITDSDEEAEKLKETVEKHLNGIGGHIYLCRPNNTGAKIEYIE
jgi:predicted sugar kinase